VPYATYEQLLAYAGEAQLIELSDRSGAGATVVDAALCARALTDADALIDGHLAGRHDLPLVATPPLLTTLALPIALYKAHSRSAPEKVRQDYEDAVRVLERIADGRVKLDVAGSEPAVAGGGAVRDNAPARPLTADTLRGYI
jgi:phage gp36-like protein